MTPTLLSPAAPPAKTQTVREIARELLRKYQQKIVARRAA
jgi:hypothetical protein